MSFDEICIIDDSIKYNRELDKYLDETGVLPKELIKRFNDAYRYDAATPMQWLIKKLKIIQGRINRGQRITSEEGDLLDMDTFRRWIKAEYPSIFKDILQ